MPTVKLVCVIAIFAPFCVWGRGIDDTHCNSQQDATAVGSYGAGLLHFTLQQTIRAPIPTAPARLPECPHTKKLTAWLAAGVEQQFLLNVTVETRLLQRLGECSFSSFISYRGSGDLRHRLVEAADTQQLCTTLPTYCEQAFPPDSRYALQSTSGDANPVLPPVIDFGCKQFTFEQRLDHFNPDETRMFAQTYWTCAAAWPEDKQQQEQSGHIIVFLGNESPLGTPKQPIVFENARRLNALVLLVEHRYYGNSLPFPQDSKGKMLTWQYKWLTMEQVMEDTAIVLAHVRAQHQVPAAVPAIVIGGSYGGMIASYHRVVKPGVFASAVAASAPVHYIIGTDMWHCTSNSYHKHIATSLERFGGKACRKTVRDGIAEITSLARSSAGRRKVAAAFQLCGDAATALPSTQAAFALQMDIMGAWQGFAQVNNQPGLIGQVELACRVALDASAAGAPDYAAVAAVNSFFSSNGSASWCYGFNATDNVFIPSSRNSYSYQVCTQGTVFSSVLPAQGSRHTLSPHFDVHLRQLAHECRAAFGRDVPAMAPPLFGQHIERLLMLTGGVVFTNGDCDGWAGGSLEHWDGLVKQTPAQPGAKLAFVTYKNASHCTDTHTNTWDTPGEPPAWKQQRAQAMDYAAGFAAAFRQALQRSVAIVR